MLQHINACSLRMVRRIPADMAINRHRSGTEDQYVGRKLRAIVFGCKLLDRVGLTSGTY